MIQNLDKLLPEEKQELQELYLEWEEARNAKNWGKADKLREVLSQWDTHIINDKLWHPQFEQPLNRERRAQNRMQNYKVSIYPWEYKP